MTVKATISEKEEIVNTLINQKADSYKLVVTLKMQNKLKEAENVKNKALVLSAKIDDLLGKLMDEWVVDSAALLKDLSKVNTEINDSIEQIKKKIKVAENVVKFLKNLDKAIEVASKILLSL